MVFTNANKHSYQLQNDSRPAGAQSAYRPCRTTAVVATPALRRSFPSPFPLQPSWTFDHPHPQSREGSWPFVPFLYPFSSSDSANIWHSKSNEEKDSEVTICTNHEETILPLQNRIAGSGCGKLMWKSEEDCGRIWRVWLQGAGAIRRK